MLPAKLMTFVRYRTMRSPGSICSARGRLRSLIPITLKPWARVASWFSGEAVRIQVWETAFGIGEAQRIGCRHAGAEIRSTGASFAARALLAPPLEEDLTTIVPVV